MNAMLRATQRRPRSLRLKPEGGQTTKTRIALKLFAKRLPKWRRDVTVWSRIESY